VPNTNDVKRDMIALNRWPGRAVAPELRPGREPDTMDVDLKVTDQAPLHGSIELNNRHSADTTPLRLVGSAGYDNLWQRGDSIAMFFQLAPQNTADALVYSIAYSFRIPNTDLTVLASYLKSDSNVASVGGTDVVGKGQIAGLRLQKPLPGGNGFSQNMSVGADYKNYAQTLTLAGQGNHVPLTYYPVTFAYDASWAPEKSRTDMTVTTVLGTPWAGSTTALLDNNRAYASASFMYVRAALTHTHELPWGMQFWARVQGQATTNALVPNEQFAAGGADTVRGYLEAEALGDNGAAMQIELRSKSFAGAIGPLVNELRVHVFADGAITRLNQPLPEQRRGYGLSSIGFGLRARIAGHATATLDNAITLSDATTTKHDADTLLFRLLGDF